jgi:hypothetical protein
MIGLVVSASISTVDLATLNFQANKTPSLATSPHPVGPSASSANSKAVYCAIHGTTTFSDLPAYAVDPNYYVAQRQRLAADLADISISVARFTRTFMVFEITAGKRIKIAV